MASLRKRPGRQTYYARYYPSPGARPKDVSLKTASLKEAKLKLKELEVRLAKGYTAPAEVSKTPVINVLSAFLGELKAKKSRNSYPRDVSVLRTLFGVSCPGGQHKRSWRYIDAPTLEELSVPLVKNIIDWHVRDRGIGPKTANNYRELVVRVINWAMAEFGVIMPGGKNPINDLSKYPEPKRNHHHIKFLSLDEIDFQLRVLNDHPHVQMAVAIAIYAGLRREEIFWVKRDHVILDGPNPRIEVHGKIDERKVSSTKTGVTRDVKLSAKLRSMIASYVGRAFTADWFLPNSNGEWWSPDCFSHQLDYINSKYNLNWGCAEYRHTFGTQLAKLGRSEIEISQLMGNSPEVCRKNYIGAVIGPETIVDF